MNNACVHKRKESLCETEKDQFQSVSPQEENFATAENSTAASAVQHVERKMSMTRVLPSVHQIMERHLNDGTPKSICCSVSTST